MGNKCQSPCHNLIDEKILFLQQKSQNQEVRKANLKNCQKLTIIGGTNNEAQLQYYYMHNKNNYSQGIIFAGSTFYEGGIDNNHMAKGYGLERMLNQDESQSSFQGHFFDGARNGKGKFKSDKLEFQGEWKNGFPVRGIAELKKLSSSKSQLKYAIEQLQFNNYQMTTSFGTIILPEGTKYEGQFVKNKNGEFVIQGLGTMKFPSLDKYNGGFKGGKFHGQQCTYTWKNQKKQYKGQYKNGLKDGHGKFYFTDKKYIEGVWVKGKKEGKFKVFEQKISTDYEQIDEVTYHEDKLQISN